MVDGGEQRINDWHTIEVTQNIKTIGVKVLSTDWKKRSDQICGIRLWGDDYEELHNETWKTGEEDKCEWIYNSVPENQQICGLSSDTSEEYLRQIVFLLAKDPRIPLSSEK